MTKIQDLFAKPIERPIEGVIKADDERNLQNEVEEYVITAEVAKSLDDFVDRYLGEIITNGVWISGFFGSGKSHLLKMLSLILENRELAPGVFAADLFLPKIDDEILKANLLKATKIPSQSILFNIDQKSDAIGGDHASPILEVFVKVLNELQGYYSRQGHIAQFEYELDDRGEYVAFKEAYATETGRTWEDDLPVLETLENETFAKVYADFFGKSYEEGLQLFDRMRGSYKVSIESFCQRVKKYINQQGSDFRLNFFVDEVGQFIGQDSKLMLNLQTIAETLATVCEGRAWVFVTSQGALQTVLGALRDTQGQDFTKIEARFKTRLTLTGADVREVIQKRLLAKHEDEPEVLTDIYDKEKENLQTMYRFGDGSVEYKSWRGSDEFCDFYPFHPYQFDLFQRAIEQLSRHDAFTGQYTSVGERSMLAVFQEVAQKLSTQKIGHLATFDQMFDGISAALRGDIQTSVRQVEHHIDDPMPIRIIKALFLLKWVTAFKATPRNVAILLIDKPDVDIQQHEKDVREALNLLERQSYLQRNGDVYEFLTDTEKDIEVEIKNTEIDEPQLTKLLSDILFADILKDPKIRYEGNNQDYAYARRLDDQLVGKDADLSLNLITPEHEQHSAAQTLAAQNTGKSELLAILPTDLRIMDDARLYLKTQKYIQQNTGGNVDETRRAILTQRGQQNSMRRTALQKLCAELLSKAPVYLNGTKLTDIGEGEARNRFAKASQALISFAYPSLRMLKGKYDDNTLSETMLKDDDLFSGSNQTLSEAEQEVLLYVTSNQNQGERTLVDEMIRRFARKPYGWYPMAVLTLIGRLYRMGKVELRTTDLLDSQAALDVLKNSRQHGSIRVRLQEQFDNTKVNALKRFHQDFFDKTNDGKDPRSVGQNTVDALKHESEALQMLLNQSTTYAFLNQLTPVKERIDGLAKKDYSYLLNNLSEFEDDLLDAKDDLLSPIKTFMHGTQRKTYDEVVTFYKEQEANFSEIPDEELDALKILKIAENPFRGQVLPDAKAAVSKVQSLIQSKLKEEKERALKSLQDHEGKLQALPEFSKLETPQQTRVLEKTETARATIDTSRYISAIRDRLHSYTTQDYPAQLALANRLALPEVSGGGEKSPQKPGARYIPASKLRIQIGLPYIQSEDDLNVWLDALRKAAQEELKNGNRITL